MIQPNIRSLAGLLLLLALPVQGNALDLTSYFSPLHPDIARPSSYPEHLEFLLPSEILEPEQVENMLQGAWQPVYHCNGAPVSLDLLIRQAPADGYVKSQLYFQFDGDQFLWQKIPVNSVANHGVANSGGGTYRSIGGRFSVGYSHHAHTYRLHFYNRALAPGLIRPLYSPETKSWAMELFDGTLGFCQAGVPLRILLVPVPLS